MKYRYDRRFGVVVCSPNNVEEILEMIIDIGFDYDGCCDSDSLKSLVDELVALARNGEVMLQRGKIRKSDTKIEDKNSRLEAYFEQKKFKDNRSANND